MIDDAQVLAVAFRQDPRGLGAAAFHSEDFFARCHGCND
jgi:hypothetical protein